MSHKVTIQSDFKNLDMLTLSLTELRIPHQVIGTVVKFNEATYRWFEADTSTGSINGDNDYINSHAMDTIRQRYSYNVVKSNISSQYHEIVSEQVLNGEIRLICRAS